MKKLILIAGVIGIGALSFYLASVKEQSSISCPTKAQGAKYDYVKLEGKVTNFVISPASPPVDCIPYGPHCRNYKMEGLGVFYAFMEPLENAAVLPFEVMTQPEDYQILLKERRPYMEKGKSYMFCARKREEPKPSGSFLYFIDDKESIHQLKLIKSGVL